VIVQIYEVVGGFGDHNMTDIPGLVRKYGFEKTWDIVRAVIDEVFYCEKCEYSFRLKPEAITLPHLTPY
jgi:hypothetical protein